MSHKLEKDEEVNIHGADRLNPESVKFSELVFAHGASQLDWKDIHNSNFVCKNWTKYVNGPFVLNSTYRKRFYEAFNGEDEKIVAFHQKRADEDQNESTRCLLLILEGQMLLRELAEYKKQPLFADTMLGTIRDQLAKLNFGDEDEADLLAKIQQLRNELVTNFARNDQIEKEQKVTEFLIGLLIQHRTSIFEFDRRKGKKKKHGVEETIVDADIPQLHKDHKLKELYSNLFYLIRTEARYVAKLSFLLPANPKEKEWFANVIILRLYANAFSPLEEFLLLDLLSESLANEVNAVDTVDEFVSSNSVVSHMLTTYNTRKEGKTYVQNTFISLFKDLLSINEDFGGTMSQKGPNIPMLTKYCDMFFDKILETRDQLPYGYRYLCKQISRFVEARFEKKPDQLKFHFRALGYYVFYRFMGCVIIRPDQFGIVEDAIPEVAAFNLVALSKVLKSAFMLTEEKSGPFTGMNEWILSKHDQVRDYIKDVIDVPDAEEKLQVNKYAQLARKDKATIIIPLKEICHLHALLLENKPELTTELGANDPLSIILDEIGRLRKCPENNTTEIQLTLNNRFPPVLNTMDRKKNLKTDTINEAIKVLRKIPGFSGDTFLEIFVRMKLHCKKIGEEELANEVNQVIANLQNLAKYGLVSPKDGFNSFLKDISLEIQQRHTRRQEHLRELERLKVAINELEEAKKHMEQKNADFQAYLKSLRTNAEKNFKPKTKSFKYKELYKARVISDSEIPTTQQGKVIFEITHHKAEEFSVKGKIKGIPAFSRNFELKLSDLLTAKEEDKETFDTEKGLELHVNSTLFFLNMNFYKNK